MIVSKIDRYAQIDRAYEQPVAPNPHEVQQAPAQKRQRSESLHSEDDRQRPVATDPQGVTAKEDNMIDLTSPEKPKTNTKEAVIDLTTPTKRAKRTSAKIGPAHTIRTKDTKSRCSLVLYDDVAFTETLTYDTFAYLRQMRPDLLPWKWQEDGTLFGSCMFAQAKTEKAYDASTKVLVETDVYYLHWFCTAGCLERHQVKIRTRPSMLLGVGLTDRDNWTKFLKEDVSTTALCFYSTCEHVKHWYSEPRSGRSNRTCINVKGSSSECKCEVGTKSGLKCMPDLRIAVEDRLGHYISSGYSIRYR